jgi:hypothetical protein
MRLNEANENGDFFGRNSSGNRRSRRLLLFQSSRWKKAEQPWEYARKGGTLGGTESVLFRVFTAIYGYLRITGEKQFRTAGEAGGSGEKFCPAPKITHAANTTLDGGRERWSIHP